MSPDMLDGRLGRMLEHRKRQGRFRSLKEYDTSPGSGLTDFSSNDYLSLTTDADLRASYLSTLSASPVVLGSTGSRLLSGGTCTHAELESRLTNHFGGAEGSGLLFNSGWDANVSFFGTVPQPDDWVVYDELIHASVHSGMRASRVPGPQRHKFAHNDADDLALVLSGVKPKSGATVFLALESLYSMDGDFAPLPALLDVFDAHVPRTQQCVVVDEAHTTGVYGPGGRGVVYALGEHSGSDDDRSSRPNSSQVGRSGAPGEHGEARAQGGGGRVTVRLMTFGKGAGASGALLLASPMVRSFLINFARPFIFSTALPLSTVLSLEAVWTFLAGPGGDEKRADLERVIAHLHGALAPLLARVPSTILRLPDPTPTPFPSATGMPADPPAPIVGLLTPTPHALSAYLLERGFIVRPVVPPTVPPGGERVRVCLRAGVGTAKVDELVRVITDWADEQLRDKARL